MASNFSYPPNGLLRGYYAEGDFLDGQSVPLPHPPPDAADLAIATIFRMPAWVKLLLALRNVLVAPLGLKTGSGEDLRLPEREEIVAATFPGLFAVHAATKDEVILGADDKHLDFRVSVLRSLELDIMAICTWVRPHNLLGRAYLTAVYPFHRLIVARCLANAAGLGVTAVNGGDRPRRRHYP